MVKKLMKHLANNPGLKILSIVIAVILWLVVVNFNNPKITNTFTIPVTVINNEVLEDMGKTYDPVGQTDRAVFYVKGDRSYMDKLDGSDFVATADLSQIVDIAGNSDEKLVPINISVNSAAKRFEDKLTITQKTVNMQIRLEDLATKQAYISYETKGNPAEGFAIGDVTASPNLIKISGPRSIVSRVSKVVTSVDVEGLAEDINVNVEPVLYDENGAVIQSDRVSLSQSRIEVSVQILGTKQVPVYCTASGTPAEGYRFIELEYAPETIMIKGEPSVLNQIQGIRIPEDAIDLEGATGDVENSIDITPYLDALGVSLVNSDENKIAVKAMIEQLEVRNMELPMEALQILNQPENLDVTFEETKLTIPVRGMGEELSELTESQIQVSVNLLNLPVGVHAVAAEVTLDERFEVVGTVTLHVHIMNKEEENTNEDGAGNQIGNGGANENGDQGGGTGGNNKDENEDDEGTGGGTGGGSNGSGNNGGSGGTAGTDTGGNSGGSGNGGTGSGGSGGTASTGNGGTGGTDSGENSGTGENGSTGSGSNGSSDSTSTMAKPGTGND